MTDKDIIMRTIFRSNRVLLFDNSASRASCIALIAYRAELTLYEILCNSRLFGGSLEDFHKLLGDSPKLRAAEREVIERTIIDFPFVSHFNYDNPKPVLPESRYRDRSYRGYRLFSESEAEGWIDYHLFHAETHFYLYQLYAAKNYSWLDFLDELQENDTMWLNLILSFWESVIRMDFKPAWHIYLYKIVADAFGDGV